MSSILGGCLVAAGSLVILGAVLMKRHARKQHAWESVSGTIASSKVKSDGEYFWPSVEYSYNYRNQVFRNDKLWSFSVDMNWRGPARKSAARYPAGTTVRVLVDPNDPRSSVLEPGGDRKFFPLMLSVAGALIIVGALYLIAAPRA